MKKYLNCQGSGVPYAVAVIRSILIDIDGTLVGKHGIHANTWPALQAARERGIHLGLCTGRIGGGHALEFARQVAPDDLHVFHSGAVITQPDQPAIHTSDLPQHALQELVAISRRESAALEVYTVDRYFLEQHTDLTRVHAEHLDMEPGHADLLSLEGHLVRAQWVVHESIWPHLRELSEQLEGVEISPATAPWSPGTIFGSVTRQGTSKSSAARWIAEHYGYTINEVCMIGDGENDLEAIVTAGFGVAMGNAPAAVRTQADAVVGDVDDGGLAQAIHLALERP